MAIVTSYVTWKLSLSTKIWTHTGRPTAHAFRGTLWINGSCSVGTSECWALWIDNLKKHKIHPLFLCNCVYDYVPLPYEKTHACFVFHFYILCTFTNLMYCSILPCSTEMIDCKSDFRIMPVNNYTVDKSYRIPVIQYVQMLLVKYLTLPIW